jgi:hypothetical protein
MEHEGTKYEHSSVNAPIDMRTPFTYCSLCNGWFPRHDEVKVGLLNNTMPHFIKKCYAALEKD